MVGAGPTGLTLGIELLRRGVPVRLIDRESRPHPHSKAIVLWPRALEVFHRLGVAGQILEQALPLPVANYHSGGRRVARIVFDGLAGSRFGAPVSLPQEQTESVLRSAFRSLGGEVEFGVALAGFEQSGGLVRARLEGPHESKQAVFSGLVGCDGAHSTVRKLAGIGFHGLTYPQTFLLADGACATGLAHSEAHYFMTSRGVLVVVGLPGGEYRVFAGAGSVADTADPLEVLQGLAAERCPVPLRLGAIARTGVFRVHARQADRFRSGAVFLAGDAAHIHSPAGGQGLNTAVEDAHTLAWRLALPEGYAAERELLRWEQERRQVSAAVVADTDRQTRMWMLTGWRGRARDAALSFGQRSGLLNRLAPPRMAQLHHTHPGYGRPVGRFVPGRRVPDLTLGGEPVVRVHDLLRDGGPVRLVLAADAASPEAVTAAAMLLNSSGSQDDALPGARQLLRVLTVPSPAVAARITGGYRGALRVLVDRGGSAHRRTGASGPVAVSIRPDGVVEQVRRGASAARPT